MRMGFIARDEGVLVFVNCHVYGDTGDGFPDTQTLEYVAGVANYHTPRITALFRYPLNVLEREGSEEIDEEACAMLAVSPAVMEELTTRQEANKNNGDDTEEAR